MSNNWSFFCQICKKHRNSKEETIQKAFEEMFAELFGYSRLLGEIESQRVIRVGSTDRVIPDIIIRDSSKNKDLFIVELKQLNLNSNENFKNQLISYMKLLSLNVGILICDAIYICFLDNYKPIWTKIEILEDNKKGEMFLEIFYKNNFTLDRIKDFILKEQKFDNNVQKIIDELKKIDIKDIVKPYFLDNFEKDEIDAALANIIIYVVEKPGQGPHEPDQDHKLETIQKWIQRIFEYLFVIDTDILTKEVIDLLHNLEYSKRTFGIGYALLVDTQNDTIISGHARYWQTPIGKYYVCSQWRKAKDSEYAANIRKWLNKIFPDYANYGLERKQEEYYRITSK